MNEENLRRHKHNRVIEGRRMTWQVARLWDLACDLPVEEVSLDTFAERDRNPWFGGAWPPTVRNVVLHCRRILDADLSVPIILNVDGRIMDGIHRLAKAMLEGRETISAVRFTKMPPPDVVVPVEKHEES